MLIWLLLNICIERKIRNSILQIIEDFILHHQVILIFSYHIQQ